MNPNKAYFKPYYRNDVNVMAAGQDLQVSPLEVITSRTAMIQQKISCSTQKYIQEICTLRYMKVSVMELGEGERWEPQTRRIGVQPHTGQTRGAEAANQPEGLLHNEAKCRVRCREAVQRMAIVDQLPSSGKQRHRWGIHPSHFPVACSSLQPSLSRPQKGRSNILA